MVTGVFFSTEYLVPSIETRLVEKEKMAVYNMEEEGPAYLPACLPDEVGRDDSSIPRPSSVRQKKGHPKGQPIRLLWSGGIIFLRGMHTDNLPED